MSAAAVAREPAAPPDPLGVYRDDGLLARALGRELAGELPLPAAAIVLAGLVPLLVVAALRGGDVSDVGAAVVIVWILLTVGASRRVPDTDRIAWAAPPLARATEYIALIWIAALHGASAYPAAYALIAALTFRHYDLVYRLRHRGVVPAPWVSALSLGWDGRLVLAYLLLVAGTLPAGLFVLAIVFGVAFVGEAVYGWVVVGRVERSMVRDDEEGDE
jgi:hypothetical protein